MFLPLLAAGSAPAQEGVVRKVGLRRALTGPRSIITAVLVALAALGLVVAPLASAAPSTEGITDLAFIWVLKNEALLTGAAHTLCLYAGTSRPNPGPGLLL
jgi:hypothetical protein